MKPITMSDEELRDWVNTIIVRAQDVHLYGTVKIHFENGRITRTNTESIEKPENTN